MKVKYNKMRWVAGRGWFCKVWTIATWMLIAVGDYMNIKVPLSSIRPMPRKDGE